MNSKALLKLVNILKNDNMDQQVEYDNALKELTQDFEND